jgi:hypothetical protein
MKPGPPTDLPDRQPLDPMHAPDLRPLLHPDHTPPLARSSDQARVRTRPDEPDPAPGGSLSTGAGGSVFRRRPQQCSSTPIRGGRAAPVRHKQAPTARDPRAGIGRQPTAPEEPDGAVWRFRIEAIASARQHPATRVCFVRGTTRCGAHRTPGSCLAAGMRLAGLVAGWLAGVDERPRARVSLVLVLPPRDVAGDAGRPSPGRAPRRARLRRSSPTAWSRDRSGRASLRCDRQA